MSQPTPRPNDQPRPDRPDDAGAASPAAEAAQAAVRPPGRVDARGASGYAPGGDVNAAIQALAAPNPGYFDRAIRAFARKVLLFVRQSSRRQVTAHKHSVDVQLKQLRHFDVPADRVVTILALGESGAADRERRQFEDMLARIESGEIGAVVVARHDRIGRNEADNVRFLDTLARHGAVLMVDGHVFDPASPEDKMILRIYGTFAEYENQLRARWMRLTALAAAKRLAFRVRLPSPLVWASPDDPAYVERLHGAGLGDWLEGLPREPVAGRVFTLAEGRRYFPLPFPDRVAVGAADLLVRWVAASDTVGDAVARTFVDPAWPSDHRGEFPVVRARRYVADEAAVEWVPIDREAVAKWVLRPALNGTYHYRSLALARALAPEHRHEVEVEISGAFRAFVEPALVPQLTRVVTSGVQHRPQRAESHHALPDVYCDHPVRGGGVCGARLHPCRAPGDRVKRYAGDLCAVRGHSSAVSPAIEGVVFDTLVEALSGARLDAHLTQGRLAAATAAATRRDAEAKARRARTRIESAAEEVLTAKEAGNTVAATHWRGKQSQYALELQAAEATLRRLAADAEAERVATARETDLIRGLATDLPALVRELAPEPALARQFLRAIGVTVHAHSPGKYAIRVTVQFPTGHCAQRWLFTQPLAATQATRTYAAARLAAGHRARDVAADLNRLLPSDVAPPWTARRVRGAVFYLEHAPGETASGETASGESPRSGAHVSPGVVAARVKVDVAEVLAAALAGALGPAWAGDAIRDAAATRDAVDPVGAALQLAPTDAELHAAFPEYARRESADARGWDPDDTVRLADAARLTWQPSANVSERARATGRRAPRGSGLARDFAGRVYVRLSEVRSARIDAAVAEAFRVAPALAALDPAHWALVGGEGAMPGRERRRLLPFAPTLTLPTARPGNSRTYAWFGPEVQARAARASLEDAIAASPYGHLPADEFHQAYHALSHFGRRFGYPSRPQVQHRFRDPRLGIPIVEALGLVQGGLHLVRYVHVPPAVWDAREVATVKRWLTGRTGRRKLERRYRRVLRAQHDADGAAREAPGPTAGDADA